jgi:predicted PurR-regulated permease PerM
MAVESGDPPSPGKTEAMQRISFRPLVTPALLVALSAAAFLAWFLRRELVLLFAAVLFGVTLYAISRWASAHTPLPHAVAVLLWTAVIVGAFAGFFVLLGQRFASEYEELGERIPSALSDLEGRLEGMPFLGSLAEQIRDLRTGMTGGGDGASEGEGGGQPAASLQQQLRFLRLGLGGVGSVIVVGVLAVFLALDGKRYYRGVLRLVPPEHREAGEDLLSSLGSALPLWVVGRLSSMGVVALLTVIGLLIIGTPLAVMLGVLAGLFSFVPYLGPIAGFVPAALVTLEADPQKILWVALLFGAVQFLESNVITPRIQQSVASVPPVALITAQVLLGVLVGLVGVMLSAPLVLAIMVVVQVVYLRHGLGEDVVTPGEAS